MPSRIVGRELEVDDVWTWDTTASSADLLEICTGLESWSERLGNRLVIEAGNSTDCASAADRQHQVT